MDGKQFLMDYSHIERAILVSILPRKTSMDARRKMFIAKAKKQDFTVEQIKMLGQFTGLPIEEVINYEKGTQKNRWQGTYKGILYTFDPDTFEIIFRKLDWQVLDTAKVDGGIITVKELANKCKEIIDNRKMM